MADEEPESFIDKMCREQSLPLRVVGGRVFMDNADPERLDRSAIELKCWWRPGLLASFENGIRVGNDKHKPLTVDDDGEMVVDEEAEEVVGWDLSECPIMLTVYRTEDGWLADNAARPEGDPIIGRFDYSAPADGWASEKRATVFAWIALGRENFALLRDRLMQTEAPDFDVGLTVQFPTGTVETSWIGETVTWDGDDSLPVISARLVWKRADWEDDVESERELYQQPEPKEYEPSREHVELLGAMNRLEAVMAKLTPPIWIAAAAAVVAAATLLR